MVIENANLFELVLFVCTGKVVASSCAPAEVARHGGDILR